MSKNTQENKKIYCGSPKFCFIYFLYLEFGEVSNLRTNYAEIIKLFVLNVSNGPSNIFKREKS